MKYLKLAWRNIWRNKRRTFITAASIFFAVFFAIIMKGLHIGFYSQATDNVVQSYTGYFQIHAKGYWNERIIDNTFENSQNTDSLTSTSKNIKLYIPRLESFALASTGQQTKGVLVIGTDFNKENQFTKIYTKLVKGNPLTANDDGVIVSQGLAEFLKTNINDTLILIGQGYHGVSAAGKFPVKGIVHFSSPELNKQLVYMNLATCQNFYSAQNRLSSLAFDLIDRKKMEQTVLEIKAHINSDKYEIMTWQDLLPELDELIKAEEKNTYIFIGILYLIVGFGIFGTVLMMTVERKREFGVMVAVGMRKYKLTIVLTLEMIFIGFIGILSGVTGSLPIVYYFHIFPYRLTGAYAEQVIQYGFDPSIPLAWQSDYMIHQALIITLFVLLASIYPIIKIIRMEVIKSLHS